MIKTVTYFILIITLTLLTIFGGSYTIGKDVHLGLILVVLGCILIISTLVYMYRDFTREEETEFTNEVAERLKSQTPYNETSPGIKFSIIEIESGYRFKVPDYIHREIEKSIREVIEFPVGVYLSFVEIAFESAVGLEDKICLSSRLSIRFFIEKEGSKFSHLVHTVYLKAYRCNYEGRRRYSFDYVIPEVELEKLQAVIGR